MPSGEASSVEPTPAPDLDAGVRQLANLVGTTAMHTVLALTAIDSQLHEALRRLTEMQKFCRDVERNGHEAKDT